MLELAILGLLKDRDLHGYELKKRLSETLGATRGVSYGSLYPALARLERSGALRTLDTRSVAPGVPVPQTGSLGGEVAAFRATGSPERHGRSRKVYRITPWGEERFSELLSEEPAADDSRHFGLRLAFARYLGDVARLGMLERRRLQLLERLRLLRARSRDREIGASSDPYLLALLEHERECVERDLSFVEALVRHELSTAVPAPERSIAPGQLGAPGRVGAHESSTRSAVATSLAPPSLGVVVAECRREHTPVGSPTHPPRQLPDREVGSEGRRAPAPRGRRQRGNLPEAVGRGIGKESKP